MKLFATICLIAGIELILFYMDMPKFVCVASAVLIVIGLEALADYIRGE